MLWLHVNVASVQLQPDPLIAVAVSPVGSVSVTLTVPVVATPPLLVTLMVYVAPVCPCVKFPMCVFVIVKSAGARAETVVASFALSFEVLLSPPPETVAVFVIEAAAFAATLTVKVIAA